MKKYIVYRIDPFRKTIIPVSLPGSKSNYRNSLLKILGAKSLNHRHVCDVDGTPLMECADPTTDDGVPGYRIRGVKGATAGKGVFFGQGPNEGFIGCPASAEWLKQMVKWLSAEEIESEDEDAEEHG